jgi:hypothetical protein
MRPIVTKRVRERMPVEQPPPSVQLEPVDEVEALIRSKPDVGPVQVIDATTGSATAKHFGNGALYRAMLEAWSEGTGNAILRGPATRGEGRAIVGFVFKHASREREPHALDLEPNGYRGETMFLLAEGLTKAMVAEVKEAAQMANRASETREVPHLTIAEVSDGYAKKLKTLTTLDDGCLYSARGAGRWRNGPAAAIRALQGAGSEQEIHKLETTPFPAKSTTASKPIRLSYPDFKSLKAVYDRDQYTIVYGIETFYYGAAHYEPTTLVYGTREAAEEALSTLIGSSSQSNILVSPLGKFLPPLKLGEGKGEVILDPFHQPK